MSTHPEAHGKENHAPFLHSFTQQHSLSPALCQGPRGMGEEGPEALLGPGFMKLPLHSWPLPPNPHSMLLVHSEGRREPEPWDSLWAVREGQGAVASRVCILVVLRPGRPQVWSSFLTVTSSQALHSTVCPVPSSPRPWDDLHGLRDSAVLWVTRLPRQSPASLCPDHPSHKPGCVRAQAALSSPRRPAAFAAAVPGPAHAGTLTRSLQLSPTWPELPLPLHKMKEPAEIT